MRHGSVPSALAEAKRKQPPQGPITKNCHPGRRSRAGTLIRKPTEVPALRYRSGGEDRLGVSTTNGVIPDGEAEPGPCAANSLGSPLCAAASAGKTSWVHPPPSRLKPSAKSGRSIQGLLGLLHQRRRARWNPRLTRRPRHPMHHRRARRSRY